MIQTAALIFILSFAILIPGSVRAEVQFLIEYFSSPAGAPTQKVDFKESEKEKKFIRLSDRAQCVVRIDGVTPLIASYRKVQVELECKDEYSKSTTSFTCQDSELKAEPAKIRALRKKEDIQLDLSVPEGVEVHRPQNKAKSGIRRLRPAWDETGCQSLGEAFAQLGPRAQIRCCRLP